MLNVFAASVQLGPAAAPAGGAAHPQEGDRIRFSVTGVGVASELITLTGVDPVVLASDGGHSRSASRSKSHKRSVERAAAAPEPAPPAGERDQPPVKRKKHSRTSS